MNDLVQLVAINNYPRRGRPLWRPKSMNAATAIKNNYENEQMVTVPMAIIVSAALFIRNKRRGRKKDARVRASCLTYN